MHGSRRIWPLTRFRTVGQLIGKMRVMRRSWHPSEILFIAGYAIARAQLNDPGPPPRPPASRPGPRPSSEPGKRTADSPTELRAIAVTASSVTLQWKDNSEIESGHIVQRADGEKGPDLRNYMAKPGTNSTTAIDPRVVAGRTYRYRVYSVRRTPTGRQGMGASNTITVRVPEKAKSLSRSTGKKEGLSNTPAGISKGLRQRKLTEFH